MSVMTRNFSLLQAFQAPLRRARQRGGVGMLMLICGLIAAPAILLMMTLQGWVAYVVAIVAAINIAVPLLTWLTAPQDPPN